MTFEKYFKSKTVGLELKNYPSIELILKDAWNAAIKECVNIARFYQDSSFTKSWNEACEDIENEITRREA